MQYSKIFKRGASVLLSAAVLFTLLVPTGIASAVGMTSGEKFLGNIIASDIPSNFDTYWNQVTPEKASMWGYAEPKRDEFNWSNLDTIYRYAKSKGMPFKFHALVWGSQQPSWLLNTFSYYEQKEEVLEWFKAAGQKYPQAEYVDVVNEPLYAPPSYKDAIGGAGSTGWDWVIWSFEQARKCFPKSKLLINECGIIDDPSAAYRYSSIIKLLLDRGLVDGIGIQCRYFSMDDVSVDTMEMVLKELSKFDLPIYVSQLDMTGYEDIQLQRYKQKFPVLWENPNVKGITLWGYITERRLGTTEFIRQEDKLWPSTLEWLKEYMSTHGGDPVIYGDLNGDKAVDALDNAQLKQYLLGQISDFTSKDGKIAADLDGSGTIDAIDFAIMKQYLLNIVTSLPVKKLNS